MLQKRYMLTGGVKLSYNTLYPLPTSTVCHEKVMVDQR